MDINEFYDDTPKQEIQVIEQQMVLAKDFIDKIVEMETLKKKIKNIESEINPQLCNAMGTNGITSYESSDKRLKISYTSETTTETIDKDKLFKEFPEAYRACVKETPRKESIRYTIREEKK